MKLAAWLAPVLLVLGLACAGGGVDTGKPFEFTDADDGAAPKKPVGTLPGRGRGKSPGKPTVAPAPTKPNPGGADAVADASTPASGGAPDSDVPSDPAADPPNQEPGDDTDATEPITEPGTDEAPPDDAGEPDEPQGSDDAALPGEVLFLSAAGVTPYLDRRQMGFVAAEMGFLRRSIPAGRYELEVRNLMGNTVVTKTITVKAGQRTLLKYKRRTIEEAGYVEL